MMTNIKYKYTYQLGNNKNCSHGFMTAINREAALSKINIALGDIRKRYRKAVNLISCEEVGSTLIIKNVDAIGTPEIVDDYEKNKEVPIFFTFLYEVEIEEELHQITGNIVLDSVPLRCVEDIRNIEEQIQEWALEEHGHHEYETAVILLNWKYF